MKKEIYEKYLKDFDENVMLYSWFPLTLRDKVLKLVFENKKGEKEQSK